jgi:hypothetical protein
VRRDVDIPGDELSAEAKLAADALLDLIRARDNDRLLAYGRTAPTTRRSGAPRRPRCGCRCT